MAAGVYDGVGVLPGAVAPCAVCGLVPVVPPSGPLCAPGVVVAPVGEEELEPEVSPVLDPLVGGTPVAVSPAAPSTGSSVSSGASRPPFDGATIGESEAGGVSL